MRDRIRLRVGAAAALAAGLLCAAALVAAGCASSKPSNNPSQAGKGFRTIEATVVEREQYPTTQGTGAYYLGFEAKDGEATVHYRFPVTRDQYNRYHEGDHVQLVMADNDLREIRQIR